MNGNNNSTVTLGNNQLVKVIGKRSVKIKKFIDGGWHDSIITDILYVPDLKKNLFSEGVLTKKGMTIIKKDNHVKVYDKIKKLVAIDLRQSNNLYRMLFQTVS